MGVKSASYKRTRRLKVKNKLNTLRTIAAQEKATKKLDYLSNIIKKKAKAAQDLPKTLDYLITYMLASIQVAEEFAEECPAAAALVALKDRVTAARDQAMQLDKQLTQYAQQGMDNQSIDTAIHSLNDCMQAQLTSVDVEALFKEYYKLAMEFDEYRKAKGLMPSIPAESVNALVETAQPVIAAAEATIDTAPVKTSSTD